MSVHALSYVLRHSDEEGSSRLVLIVLADHAHNDGTNAYPSVETIRHEARLKSRRTVQTALRRLEQNGSIRAEGQVRRGVTNWTVVMDPGAQNMRSAEDAPAQSTTPEGRKDCAQTITKESSNTPSSPPLNCQRCGHTLREDGVCEVCHIWRHWQGVMGHEGAKLDEARLRVIQRALRIATVAECCRAISGCSRSDFHMARGKYAGQRRQDHLSLILRNRENIERFMEGVPETADRSSADGFTSSAQDAKIREHKRNVLRAFDLAGSAEARRSGDESERWLAQHGIRVVRKPDERPTFTGSDEAGS